MRAFPRLHKQSLVKSPQPQRARTQTPWVRDSLREAESRSRVATLLREDTVLAEIGALTAALKSYQNGDGGFPWIPGGESDACVASIHLLLP
jgi:hypothetical protein